jgi:hypothetical protein
MDFNYSTSTFGPFLCSEFSIMYGRRDVYDSIYLHVYLLRVTTAFDSLVLDPNANGSEGGTEWKRQGIWLQFFKSLAYAAWNIIQLSFHDTNCIIQL